MASNPTSGNLITQANRMILQLAERFGNIVELAPVEEPDQTKTAVKAYEMQVEAAALVRAAEEVLSLTRSLKEAWLFGPLDTLEKSGEREKANEDAKVVAGELKTLLNDKRARHN